METKVLHCAIKSCNYSKNVSSFEGSTNYKAKCPVHQCLLIQDNNKTPQRPGDKSEVRKARRYRRKNKK
jgi:hypothetical protein